MKKVEWMMSCFGRDIAISEDTDGMAATLTIEETAHSLSLINRFTGHTKHRYSVAQHSILCMYIAEALGYTEPTQFACLMHDAHEAITGDVSFPVKLQIGSDWRWFEDKVEHRTHAAFGITDVMAMNPARVKEVDLIALATERKHLMRFTAANRPWGIIDGDINLVHPIDEMAVEWHFRWEVLMHKREEDSVMHAFLDHYKRLRSQVL